MKSNQPKQTRHFLPIIIDTVCLFTGISSETLKSKTRKREVVEARQIAMRIAKALTNCSLAVIGADIGRKDHATVLHACRTINNLCETNYKFKAKFEDIIAECRLRTDTAVDESYVCYICGTREVQIRAWIDANTRREVDGVSDGEEEDCWCPNCKKPVQITTREEYLIRLGIKEEERLRRINDEEVAKHREAIIQDRKDGYDKQLKQLERELEI